MKLEQAHNEKLSQNDNTNKLKMIQKIMEEKF